jgi:uncharacterized protein YbjQ (UPF0145 family)
MIVTTTSSIPNEEIKSIISVVHNRVVLEANIINSISVDKLTKTTDDVIEGLTKKALELKADALIDLKIDAFKLDTSDDTYDWVVTAIGTAVLLKTK